MWRGRFRRITGTKHRSVTQGMFPPTLKQQVKVTSEGVSFPFACKKSTHQCRLCLPEPVIPDCYTHLPFQEIPSQAQVNCSATHLSFLPHCQRTHVWSCLRLPLRHFSPQAKWFMQKCTSCWDPSLPSTELLTEPLVWHGNFVREWPVSFPGKRDTPGKARGHLWHFNVGVCWDTDNEE